MPASAKILDATIAGAYLLAMFAVGARFSRSQTSTARYFLADRNVRWWLILFSIVATETSVVTFASVPGVSFDPHGGNLCFLQLAMGYILGRIIAAYVLLPRYFKGPLVSIYPLLLQRFGRGIHRMAAATFLLTRNIADGLRLYITGLLFGQLTGIDARVSIIGVGIATTAYTFLGGAKAIVWTDLLQFATKFAAMIIAAACLLPMLTGGAEAFLQIGRGAGKLQWLDLSLGLDKPYTLWSGLIGGAFLSMASHGADQLIVQRCLCSRTLSGARVAMIGSGFVVFLQFLILLGVGVGLSELQLSGKLGLPAHARNDEVFGFFIAHALPPGVVGLCLAGVVAAAMSTLAASLNSSAAALLVDFYQPMAPGRPERHYVRVARWFTTASGLVQTGIALFAWYALASQSLVNIVLAIAGITSGALLGLFLLGTSSKSYPPIAVWIGFLSGLATVGCLAIAAIMGRTIVAWPWFAPIGALLTVFVSMAAVRFCDWFQLPLGPRPNPTREN